MNDTFYSKNLALLKDLNDELEATAEGYLAAYVGSAMALDPCGRYHHILMAYVGSSEALDPCRQHHRASDIYREDAPDRCVQFWKALDAAADRLGGWIEAGEGDPTDVFFYKSVG